MIHPHFAKFLGSTAGLLFLLGYVVLCLLNKRTLEIGRVIVAFLCGYAFGPVIQLTPLLIERMLSSETTPLSFDDVSDALILGLLSLAMVAVQGAAALIVSTRRPDESPK
jgi:cytochrome bd-type quinol oxidase subunit 2